MSDEMQIEGKSYISSKRAAELTGYAQDYIGQLARKSLIDAHRIGGLWYVLPDSLDVYKKKAETYKPEPPTRVVAAEPGALVFFDGKEYLSAASAAQVSGYTQDYVGQLARSATILSRQVGNRWYVERESILKHKKEKDSLLGAVQSQSVGISKKTENESKEPEHLMNASYSGSGPLLNYYAESADLMPSLGDRSDMLDEQMPGLETSVSEDTGTSRSLEHVIPIRREYSKISMQNIPPRRKMTPNRQKMPITDTFKILAGAVATIVIVLSVGYVSILNKNAVYAVNFGKVPTFSELPASAATAFSRIGDLLEPYLTHELVYKRSDTQ